MQASVLRAGYMKAERYQVYKNSMILLQALEVRRSIQAECF